MDRKSDDSSPHYDAGIQPTTTRDRVSLGAARDDILPKGSVDPVYQAKAELLNAAIQEIGMGKYQWHLFVVTGFGWLADNLWPIVTGLILAPVVQEFNAKGPFLKLAQNIGLLVGALGWGVGSDIWGRKISFNTTLAIVGIFATVAAASPSFTALSVFAALWSVGVGGNLPVDSAIFLEFLPGTHQYLLTILSIWWAFGQLLGSLVAWPIISNYSCETTATTCARRDNMGWRYFLIAMGGLMVVLWFIRFFVFRLYESPKYLMGRGRFAEAVDVVHAVAKYNGKSIALTTEELESAGVSGDHANTAKGIEEGPQELDTTARAALKRKFEQFNGDHVRSLFATRTMAISTSLVIAIWAIIGLAFPLYNAFVTYFLATRGADFGDGSVYITYRNQAILSVIGVPGALLGGWAVEVPFLGRRGTLSITTVLTGVFLFASTTARSSDALLGWNCGYSFTSNIMYGVLYAMTPELFPTKDRGTGNGIAATANRIFGIMAPIIALYADLSTSVPIYVSGALFILAGLVALLLPFEPRGKASL
ncbi:putative MFS-type transporter PB1E7,08c OS=Schizosaccharomyces pombe (strain 972 / ATCC 24843) GN=SPAPB1E7.08c PE=1 SV=1 [Rhizoctonia solani AG-1 IB]|uniref:Putative MFS-type transporter PB1E7,08c n=1 Tax=Thanatephorus cucumeris (strain AG1-IB / isolate 7/3/14) TaxID=1108050 RepID=A0A0B7FUV3_THACB|nr:putative MFS-type transporter PB1E7,08c OS=Schizosaccharomyces pombe (strain 972 / ATCC 24843) GN=SPAPB1E7.08c PE=1 SV=1 [Rhizoctonia solani AG-1 IB]